VFRATAKKMLPAPYGAADFDHAMRRHSSGGPELHNPPPAGLFYGYGNDILNLIRNYQSAPTTVQANGRLNRAIDAGHTIGEYPVGGATTRCFEIVTRPSNDSLYTAYPSICGEDDGD